MAALLLLVLVSLTSALPAADPSEEQWTRFRGPNGSGIAPAAAFPTEFNQTKNQTWRVPIRPGKSSPVLSATRVFLTSAAEGKLYTQAFDRQTGRLLWERIEDRPRSEQVNALNHEAGPTPVTDGQSVFVFFKDLGLLAYRADTGKPLWKAPLGPWSVSMGVSASPLLAGSSVIVVADQIEGSFIAGFSKRNGEMQWKTERVEGEAWASPILYQQAGRGSRADVLTIGRGLFGAHDAATGRRSMNLEGISPAIVASPIIDGDTVYLFGYGDETPLPFAPRLARLDKNHDGKLSEDEYGNDAMVRGIARHRGNKDNIVSQDEWDLARSTVLGHNGVTAIRLAPGAPPRELWRTPKSLTGVIPSPILLNGVLYIIRNGGILLTLDAATGKILGESRVEGALGGYSASPVATADGHIYLASEEGKIAVLKTKGPQWSVAALNDLDEPCFATPALSRGQIYVRTNEALYRFETR